VAGRYLQDPPRGKDLCPIPRARGPKGKRAGDLLAARPPSTGGKRKKGKWCLFSRAAKGETASFRHREAHRKKRKKKERSVSFLYRVRYRRRRKVRTEPDSAGATQGEKKKRHSPALRCIGCRKKGGGGDELVIRLPRAEEGKRKRSNFHELARAPR